MLARMLLMVALPAYLIFVLYTGTIYTTVSMQCRWSASDKPFSGSQYGCDSFHSLYPFREAGEESEQKGQQWYL